MKSKNFREFLNEGIWCLPEDTQIYDDFILEIKELEEKYWNLIGDDELYDGLNATIARAKELKKLRIQVTSKKYNL
jgi:hypothetical protein